MKKAISKLVIICLIVTTFISTPPKAHAEEVADFVTSVIDVVVDAITTITEAVIDATIETFEFIYCVIPEPFQYANDPVVRLLIDCGDNGNTNGGGGNGNNGGTTPTVDPNTVINPIINNNGPLIPPGTPVIINNGGGGPVNPGTNTTTPFTCELTTSTPINKGGSVTWIVKENGVDAPNSNYTYAWQTRTAGSTNRFTTTLNMTGQHAPQVTLKNLTTNATQILNCPPVTVFDSSITNEARMKFKGIKNTAPANSTVPDYTGNEESILTVNPNQKFKLLWEITGVSECYNPTWYSGNIIRNLISSVSGWTIDRNTTYTISCISAKSGNPISGTVQVNLKPTATIREI